MAKQALADGAGILALLDTLEAKLADPGEARAIAAVRSGVQELEAQTAVLSRALSEAQQSNWQTEVFLASVCHELRGPLGALRMWVETHHLAASDEALRRRALDAVEAILDAQDRLVGDLLDASLGAAGRLTIEREYIPLADVLEYAVQSARPVASSRGLDLRSDVSPDLGGVRGDTIRLRQVVGNLLSNAIKFTPAGGTVELRAARRGAAAEIVVRDTGRGIPADLLPRLFTPFARQDGSPSRPEAGLGLGLTVVRQLVELHGGSVRAQSGGPGRGSEFTVTLPAAGPDEEPR